VPSFYAAVKKLARPSDSREIDFRSASGAGDKFDLFFTLTSTPYFFLYLAQHLRRRVSKKDGCQIDFSTPKSESAHPPVANKSAGMVCVCELRENAQTQCGKSTLQKLLKNKQLSDAKLFPRAVSFILMAGVQRVSAREKEEGPFLFSPHTLTHQSSFAAMEKGIYLRPRKVLSA
jgi:hypothetical protein